MGKPLYALHNSEFMIGFFFIIPGIICVFVFLLKQEAEQWSACIDENTQRFPRAVQGIEMGHYF